MLRWALLFLILALVAGLFGFNIVGETAWQGFKYLFFGFIVLFVVSLVAGASSRRTTI